MIRLPAVTATCPNVAGTVTDDTKVSSILLMFLLIIFSVFERDICTSFYAYECENALVGCALTRSFSRHFPTLSCLVLLRPQAVPYANRENVS